MANKKPIHNKIYKMLWQGTPQVSSLRQFIEGPKPYPKPGKDADVQVLAHIQRLVKRAEHGDSLAVEVLIILAVEAIHGLDAAAGAQPALLSQMAGKIPIWPSLFARVPIIKERVQQQARDLGVGVKLKYPAHTRLSFNERAAFVAVNSANYMGLVRSKFVDHPNQKWQKDVRALPPFTEESAPVWWPLAAQEIKRSFPSLHNWLMRNNHQGARDINEALKRVRRPFVESSWRLFECLIDPA